MDGWILCSRTNQYQHATTYTLIELILKTKKKTLKYLYSRLKKVKLAMPVLTLQRAVEALVSI